MSMDDKASSIGARDCIWCLTNNVRCIKLKSIPVTLSSFDSLSRISFSSVGQSMLLIRYRAVAALNSVVFGAKEEVEVKGVLHSSELQ